MCKSGPCSHWSVHFPLHAETKYIRGSEKVPYRFAHFQAPHEMASLLGEKELFGVREHGLSMGQAEIRMLTHLLRI
jgi:hypothetical protein